jgi:MarR family transcriptional regulator for hemolysin
MTVIARQLRKQFDQDLEGLGVTRSQWTAIAVVVRRPGATQRLIAETLDMSEAAAGRLVDRLCADGLLQRQPKEDDKRAYCVSLTKAAQPILDRVGIAAARLEAHTFHGIDDSEVLQLSSLLDRIYGNINN